MDLVGCSSVGLGDHQLGHVALDRDAAGHERLHDLLWILSQEQGLGGCVVGGDGHVGLVAVPAQHFGQTRPGVDTQLEYAVTKWHIVDGLVHHDRVRRWVDAILVLVLQGQHGVDPFVGEKGVGHGFLYGGEFGGGLGRVGLAGCATPITSLSRSTTVTPFQTGNRLAVVGVSVPSNYRPLTKGTAGDAEDLQRRGGPRRPPRQAPTRRRRTRR